MQIQTTKKSPETYEGLRARLRVSCCGLRLRKTSGPATYAGKKIGKPKALQTTQFHALDYDSRPSGIQVNLARPAAFCQQNAFLVARPLQFRRRHDAAPTP